nr:MAG TPA: hypothetical protein [Caudoviricetes sp.]
MFNISENFILSNISTPPNIVYNRIKKKSIKKVKILTKKVLTF